MKPEIKVELNIDLEEREVEKKVAVDNKEEEEGECDLPSVEDLCNKYRNVINKFRTEDSSNQERTDDLKIELPKSKTFENFENLFSQFRSSVESETGCGEKPMGNNGEEPVGWNNGEKLQGLEVGEEPVGSSLWGREGEGELLGSSLGREVEAGLTRGGEEPAKKKVRKRQLMCGKCAACLRLDCDSCRNCLDKPRNGGENTRKQKCLLRKCNP